MSNKLSWYERNKEKAKAKSSLWVANNRERSNAIKKKWRDKNKDYWNKRKKRLKAESPAFRLICNLRLRTWHCLDKVLSGKRQHIKEYLGCAPEFLKQHLESKFDSNMNWDNYGSYWQVDHIVPLASAKTLDEVYTLCHYTNLQPLERIANIRKGAKIENK